MNLTEQVQKELDERAKNHVQGFKPLSAIENLIIRGHLLVEQELIRSIELAIPNKQAFIAKNFSFYQKILIADMLGMINHSKKEIKDLNSLRNKVAHLSEEEGKTNLIDSIIREVANKSPEQIARAGDDKVAQFTAAISFMCGFIAASHRFTDQAYKVRILAQKPV